MIPRPLRRSAWFVFGAALLMRLAYLAFFPQPPVQFDARLYVAASVAVPYEVVHPSLWNNPNQRDSLDFQSLYDDVIADEKVSWYPYAVPQFPEATDALFYGGPVMTALFGSVFYLAPHYDFWCVRILLAILDSLTAVLLWLLFRRLISIRGAAIGAGLWILYFPALIKTGELVTETPAIFLAVLSVYSIVLTCERRTPWRLLGCGALFALIALTKASLSILILPLLLAWLWMRRSQWRAALGEAAFILCGWVALLAPWFLMVFLRYGSIGFRDPSYGTANFRQANALATEGYLADAAPADFWTYPVLRQMKGNPGAYAALYLQKFRRLWWHACDDYKRATGVWQDVIQWGHRLIVLYALLGMMVWVARAGPTAWFPMIVVLYLLGLHTVMHVVSRYNLVAMPFLCGAATVGGFWLFGEEKSLLRRWLLSSGLILVAAVLIGLLRPATWLLIPGVSVPVSVWLYWLGSAAVIIGTVWLVVVRGHKHARPIPLALAASAVILAATYGWIVPREGHAEWSARIDRPGVVLQRTIEIPKSAIPDSVEDGFVAIDARLEPHSAFDIAMAIDHSQANFPESELLTPESVYPKASYSVVGIARGDQQQEIRHWMRHSIDPALLDTLLRDGKVTMRVAIDTRRAHQGALLVYGDLPFADPRHRDLPGVTFSSIERYFEGGDPRLWESTPFEEEISQSTITIDGKESSQDLSPQLGRQIGEYRILLVLLLPGGRIVYY